jgi:SMC interacting uncharacterized protein involved in chromosome segregation
LIALVTFVLECEILTPHTITLLEREIQDQRTALLEKLDLRERELRRSSEREEELIRRVRSLEVETKRHEAEKSSLQEKDRKREHAMNEMHMHLDTSVRMKRKIDSLQDEIDELRKNVCIRTFSSIRLHHDSFVREFIREVHA